LKANRLTSSAYNCIRPQHAAVFCLGEKTAIQALDRLDPVLPSSPGERNGMASNTIATARFRGMRLWM
jgi:hypothetical protein